MAQRILHDHGQILHWMGAHHRFPVRGPGADDIGFASHGELEGRSPIGWQEFFPVLSRTGRVVRVDDEAGTAEVVSAAQARSAVAGA